jgi:valyl-tRNA synthetase
MYHPTDMLETGYEIIFFWVARMIMMSGYVLGMIPFKKVYFHGTVRDAKGRKMSKSLNNGIDPIEVAQKFGMDAGRMALIVGVAPGTDSKISEDKIKGYKNFANKVWNIARFIFSNTENVKYDSTFVKNTPADKELTEERKRVLEEITREMKDDKIYLASEKLYHYIWHRFADIILEESKNIFNTGKEEEKNSRKQFLLKTLDEILRALHPFMPFLTEEIWQYMPIENKKLLMVEKWPI